MMLKRIVILCGTFVSLWAMAVASWGTGLPNCYEYKDSPNLCDELTISEQTCASQNCGTNDPPSSAVEEDEHYPVDDDAAFGESTKKQKQLPCSWSYQCQDHIDPLDQHHYCLPDYDNPVPGATLEVPVLSSPAC